MALRSTKIRPRHAHICATYFNERQSVILLIMMGMCHVENSAPWSCAVCPKVMAATIDGIKSSKKARDSEYLEGSIDEWVEGEGLV